MSPMRAGQYLPPLRMQWKRSLGGAEIPAAMHLAHVAAQRRHRADGRRRHATGRLGKRRALVAHDIARSHIGQLHERADAHLIALVGDLVETRNGLEVHQLFRVVGQDLVFKRADDVGAAGDRPRLAAFQVLRRLACGGSVHMGEMLHDNLPLRGDFAERREHLVGRVGRFGQELADGVLNGKAYQARIAMRMRHAG